MDKRVMRGEETYQNIINAALTIISDQGISGVSAAKVSQGAGISKSSVFHHFKSVNEILLAALTNVIEIMIHEVKSERSGTLADILQSFEHTLFHEDDDFKKIERVFFAFYKESIFHETYKEIYDKFLEDSIDELLKSLVRTGIKKENARDLSQLMIATLDGLCIQNIITDKRNDTYKAWLHFKTMILEYDSEDK